MGLDERLRTIVWFIWLAVGGLLLTALWAYDTRGIGLAGMIGLLMAVLAWQGMRLRKIADRIKRESDARRERL